MSREKANEDIYYRFYAPAIGLFVTSFTIFLFYVTEHNLTIASWSYSFIPLIVNCAIALPFWIKYLKRK